MVANQQTPLAEEEEPVELKIDVIEEKLKTMGKLIDDVTSGKDARELHNFVQDDLLPAIVLLAQDIRSLASIVSAHDEMIADLQDEEGDVTRISEEHAAELIEHITECNNLFQQLYDQSKAAGAAITPLLQRIEKGKALIEFIKSAVPDDDDDDDNPEPN